MKISIMYKGREVMVDYATDEEVLEGIKRCIARIDLDTSIGPIALGRLDEGSLE